MDWGDVPTGAAAVVALAASGFATWEAKKARRVAEDALDEMRRQTDVMESERTSRDESEGPQFQVTDASRRGHTWSFELEMVSGPEADVAVIEAFRNGASGNGGVYIPEQSDHRMVRGTTATFVLTCLVDVEDDAQVRVGFECKEVDRRRRTWIRWETVTFPGTSLGIPDLY